MVDHGIWQWFPRLSSLYRLALVEAMNNAIGILFLAPIIYSAVFFSWRGALVTSLLSLAGVLSVMVGVWSIRTIMPNVILLLMPLLVVSIATSELEWRRKERRIAVEREAERRMYMGKALEAQEEERQRLARDLHDEIIQTLLAIANSAETLVSGDNNGGEVERNAAWIRDTAVDTVGRLREICLDLSPSVLSDLGLVPALRWLVNRVNAEGGTNARIVVKGAGRNLSPRAEIIMFRVVQEALNNIKRHAQAREAVVTLGFNAEYLRLTIEDNGCGFHVPEKLGRLAVEGKLGLVGIQERVSFLGGTLQIRSKPGEGTKLSIEVKC